MSPHAEKRELHPDPSGLRGRVRIDAAGLLDPDGWHEGPVSLHVRVGGEGPEVLGVFDPQVEQPAADTVIDRRGSVLMPGLVNAHTHLDLTGLGPRPHDPGAGFMAWAGMIRAERPTEAEAIRAAVLEGAEKSLAGGVVAVGDIAGSVPVEAPKVVSEAATAAFWESPLHGVSFVEFFGIGKTAGRGRAAIDAVYGLAGGHQHATKGVGLQPHAPYSVSAGNYAAAAKACAENGLRWSTHLAETAGEREFVARGEGEVRAFLERIGVWEDGILRDIGRGDHPVEHVAGAIGEVSKALLEKDLKPLVAHVNDATNEAIEVLRGMGATVAYCPRASEYFGAARVFGGHRYREMLERGVPVALGTDSIVNLDTAERISVWDEMRLLRARDGVDWVTLLRMATVHGGAAIGLERAHFSLRSGGRPLGIVGLFVGKERGGEQISLEQGLDGCPDDRSPELLLFRNPSGLTATNVRVGISSGSRGEGGAGP